MSTPLPQTHVDLKGRSYQLTALPSIEGQKAVTRLVKALGPVFAAAARENASTMERAAGRDEIKGLAEMYATAASIAEFCTRLTEEDLTYFSNLFMKRTEVQGDGGYISLDQDSRNRGQVGGPFACDYGLWFLLLQAHLDFNFSSFLADLASMTRPA